MAPATEANPEGEVQADKARTLRSLLRERGRDYVRATAYAPQRHGEKLPALRLPNPNRTFMREVEWYTSRPTPEDFRRMYLPKRDEQTGEYIVPTVRGEKVRAIGPSIGDPTMATASIVDDYKAYCIHEMRESMRGEAEPLNFDRDGVLAAIGELDQDLQRTLWLLGHRTTAEICAETGLPDRTVRWRTSQAVDALIAQLYHNSRPRAAGRSQ